MKKYQKILFFTLIGFIAFPTITLGGTFVSSLIQGKTVEEAVHILAQQIDSLIGRVEVLETKQAETDVSIEDLRLENESLKSQSELLAKKQARQELYDEFRSFYERFGKSRSPNYEEKEECTVQHVRRFCQEGVDRYCLLADELERTWNAYKNSFPSGTFPIINPVCGNGVIEGCFEYCDDGDENGPYPAECSTSCEKNPSREPKG